MNRSITSVLGTPTEDVSEKYLIVVYIASMISCWSMARIYEAVLPRIVYSPHAAYSVHIQVLILLFHTNNALPSHFSSVSVLSGSNSVLNTDSADTCGILHTIRR